MGVQVTTPTDLPVDGDGSHDQLTWAETGGALSVPALEGPGYAAGVVLPQNDVDYEWRQAGRHSRATVNRTVMSDEGFLSSCILYQGAFNVGGGTLSVTLAPSRVGVDADDDGGVALEVKIPAGSPLVLTASKDTYVNLKEDGSVEIQEVPNSDPAPTPSADYVAIWVLVSDGTELTAANLADGIAPFPCLGTATAGIGIRKAIIEDLTITTIAELPLSDSGATVPQSEGAIRYNGTFWTVRDQLGSHTISEPIRKWSTGFTVSSGTAITARTMFWPER